MVWRKTDTNGGPTSLYTTRNYVDYRGGLVGPERYWYYRIPLLRESHLFTAFGKAVTPEQFLPEITTVEDLRARYAGVLLAMKALSEQHNFDLYVIAFDVEGFPLAAPSYEYYAIYTVDVLGPETALALVDQFPTDELLIGDGHFAWPAHVRYEEFLYTFIQPSLREIDPTQPGPLTEAEFALLVSLPPFADKSLCGAFQSVWGRQPIIPNQYPGCADKLPTGVEVACLDDRGQWTQDSVASQQVENGIFWAEVLQGGTCGLFQAANNVN
jgi:hypothetical protein